MSKKIKVMIAIFFIFIIGNVAKSEATVTANTDSVTIYAVNQTVVEKYPQVAIPSNYAQSFKIKVSGNKNTPQYSLDSNQYVTVNTDGLVEPRKIMNSSNKATYNFGETNINISVDGQKIKIPVKLVNYSTVYTDGVMDEYIKKNITSSMSQYEKLDKICQFVVQYKYSASATSSNGMILSGGGDCWASTNTIVEMCKKVGLKAKSRDAQDYGSSSHRNAAVLVDGKVYIAEAGYDDSSVPRHYTIEEENTGFAYKVVSDNEAQIYQYDGFDTQVNIPSQLGTYKVTEIGESSFSPSLFYEEYAITKVTLPDTIKKIGKNAFAQQYKLKEINIPDSVETIEAGAFSGALTVENGKAISNPSIVKVDISSNQPYFKVVDDIIYTKDGKVLIAAVNNKSGNVVIPDTVEKITECAFVYMNITSVTMNDNVKEIGRMCFGHCRELETAKISNAIKEIPNDMLYEAENLKTINEFKEGLEKIGDDAFWRCINLTSTLNIPKSLKSIGRTAFQYTGITKVYIQDGSTLALNENVFELQNKEVVVRIPTSITKINDNIFGYYKDKGVITGKKGSVAEQVANKNGINFIDEDYKGTPLTKISIESSITMDIGGTKTLKVVYTPNNTTEDKNVQWSTNNKSVATVDKNGKVTAISSGVATITAKVGNKTASCKVTVNKYKISKCSVDKISNQTYTGKDIKPGVTVKSGKTKLKNGTDYTVTYKNNKNTGKASIIITGKGNYEGTITKYFYITPKKVTGLKVKSQETDSIKIKWSKASEKVTAYKVYSYNYKKEKWEYLGKTSDTSYKVKKLKAGTTYKFRVRAYKNIDGTQYFGSYTSSLKTTTKTATPKISKLSTKSKKVTVNWKKVSGASGYEVYMSTSKNGKYSKVKTIKNGKTVKYTKSSLKKNKKYYFKIRTYRTINGQKVYSSYSSVKNIKVK